MFICGDSTIYEYIEGKKDFVLDKRTGTPDDVKKALANGYNIIFGSVVMDRGVDVEEFQAVVLFSAGKTPIAGIQRIGRASRKRKKGLNVSLVIDFKDIEGNPIMQNQYFQRRETLNDSGVKIIDDVHQFFELVAQIEENNKT